MFIIDFDDTLFDTHAFKRARLEAVRELGVSEELYWQTYYVARNSANGFFTYSDERHAEVLAEQGFDKIKIYTALNKVTESKAKEVLDKETFVFLEKLREFNVSMVLLSLGCPAYQELKVKNTGIDSYFDRLFMVEATKNAVLDELFANHSGPAWFINDKPVETKELSEQFPQLRAVMKLSPNFSEEDYIKTGLPYFKTLAEILAYVRTNF
ncbi:MAG: hypothetical protein UR53_C0002G0008 [Candidatus Magasanikbacteria bacterium GW2011_GWC2_34_16]|uniref:Uncharacterized protein n=2 Tax=Candidatus Magasanikiibacteriota TaxID=1752731 RepID=A0A0G0KIS7_9BACT|nr:MAG: hypothetical protein UR53_C0002G0008 [Candidatus Magasanikbacteria bacterium GW2011_GWC2_34_16]KKQ40501.1 MAG: hypothetical protein US58_C0019G0014 [Candidatus Magasanikbacteria bacterium GW2011_GWA2_37_8]